MTAGQSLEGLTPPGPINRPPTTPRTPAPKGFEPGVAYCPDGITPSLITTPPMEALAGPEAWQRAVESMGVQLPDGYALKLVTASYIEAGWRRDQEFVEHPETGKMVKAPAVTRPTWAYRFAVVEVHEALVNDLLESFRGRAPKPAEPRDGHTFVCPVGDTQIGEWTADGGTKLTLERFYRMTGTSIARARSLRKAWSGHVVLPWLGDCIQGMNSQRGQLIMRTDLTQTEMTRVFRRLMQWQIEEWARVASSIVIPVVPGNHDDAHRLGDGPSTRHDDSHAVESASAVADAFAMRGGYEHVSFVFPKPDEDTITLDVAGTKVGFAHGHQWNGSGDKGHEWWAKQAHGRTPIGDADIALTAHRHHYYASEAGASKLLVGVPAMVSTSAYWKRGMGDDIDPGMLSMLIGGGRWSHLDVAR